MGGNYQNNGVQKYQADPIKQFLISRGSARDRAVELCVAGKIELKDIPDYTDRLTLLHFAGISVSPDVDQVIAAIAEKVRIKVAAQKKYDEEADGPEAHFLICSGCGATMMAEPGGDPVHPLCELCSNRGAPMDYEREEDGPDYLPDNEPEPPADEPPATEPEPPAEPPAEPEQKTEAPPEKPDKVQCPTCLRMYANARNLNKHQVKVHGLKG
jgi:hypothetical protein